MVGVFSSNNKVRSVSLVNQYSRFTFGGCVFGVCEIVTIKVLSVLNTIETHVQKIEFPFFTYLNLSAHFETVTKIGS